VRRFNLYRRGKIYYVRYWDEKTQSYASGKSTGEADERAAMATAAHWDKYGFPDGSSTQSVTDIHAILETARTAPLEPAHVQKIVSILTDRGMLTGATLNDAGPPSEPLSEFLKTFWAYDESPYVAEKLAYGQKIGRRHCEDSLLRVSHWRRFFPENTVCDITRDMIREFQMDLSKRGLAPKTINAVVDAGAVPLRWLHDRGDLPKDPTEGLRRFSGTSKQRGILTTEETCKLFQTQWNDDRACVGSLVAATCGLRAGEVLALRPGDIKEDRLLVRHSWCRTSGLKETKTGEAREVPLLPDVRRELLRLAAENPHGAGPGRFIFYGEVSDAPMSENILRRGLDRALCEMVVPAPKKMTPSERKSHRESQREALSRFRERGICFHSWRHGYATALAASLEMRQVQMATGHQTAAMATHYSNHQREEDFLVTAQAASMVFQKVIPFDGGATDGGPLSEES
jgi:integrase